MSWWFKELFTSGGDSDKNDCAQIKYIDACAKIKYNIESVVNLRPLAWCYVNTKSKTTRCSEWTAEESCHDISIAENGQIGTNRLPGGLASAQKIDWSWKYIIFVLYWRDSLNYFWNMIKNFNGNACSYSMSEATEEVLSRGYLEVCLYVCPSVTNDVVNITVTRSSLKKTGKKSRIKLQLLARADLVGRPKAADRTRQRLQLNPSIVLE